MDWKQGEFTITDRREDLDVETIHNFLRESYWAKGTLIWAELAIGLFH